MFLPIQIIKIIIKNIIIKGKMEELKIFIRNIALKY